MILLFHNLLHFTKLLNKKYGTHTESRILHLHKIFYSAIPKDKFVFLEIRKICQRPQDVVSLLEKIFQDIREEKAIQDFRVKKELKGGVGKILNDTLIFEPNVGGIGINLNSLFKFLKGR